MTIRQKYLITLTIAAVTGLLPAQQAPDSLNATETSKATDTAAKVQPVPGSSKASARADTAVTTAQSAPTAKKPKTTEPVLLIKSKNDTVIVITDENNIKKIMQNMSNTVKKSRVQGYGGAGGFSNRLVTVNMNPVVDLVNTDSKLEGISFPNLKNGYRLMTMSGGLGYGGLGNGIRIGGGGYGGSCKYVSTAFAASDTTPDSLLSVALKVSLGYGGLLIEKAFVKDNWNMYLGAFIGGGAIEVQKITSPVGKTSAFSDTWTDPKNGERATAAFMSTELHGGTTYTIVPWMHIGGDFNALLYYSSSGFGQATSNSIFGITPGIGFRVIFGNIG